MARKGWIELAEALDRLSMFYYQKSFSELGRGKEARRLFKKMEELWMTGTIKSYLEVGNPRLELTQNIMLGAPFGVHFQLDNSPGLETCITPGELVQVLLKKSDFDNTLKAINLGVSSTTEIQQLSRANREKTFQRYLEEEILRGRWQKKEKFRKVAEAEYHLNFTAFKSIWRETTKRTGCLWDKPGRHKDE